MRCGHARRYLSRLGMLGLVSLLVVGCVIQDPPALIELGKARNAIDDAKKKGAQERFPAEFQDLEKRHLQARGVFYACMDDKAFQLAQGIITDANALANRQLARPTPPPPPANPMARFTVPPEVEVNTVVPIDASASSDPEGNPLSYSWDFGDGTTAKFTFPRTTHRYTRPGSYTVRLTVDNGKGGTDTASSRVIATQKIVLSEERGKVLFDFDKATLKPAAISALASVVQTLREDTTLRAHIVGHTDSVGTDQYNLGLSERRAKSVQSYFISQGIAANRLTVDWKGESEPAFPNTTAENRARNRRVEITLRPGN